MNTSPGFTLLIALSRLTCLAVFVAALGACQTGAKDSRTEAEMQALKRVRFADSPEGARAVLDNAILFPVDSAALYPQADGILDALKPSFAKARGQIIVEGHTDSTGSTERNTRLSLDRAEAVKAALIKRQVPPARIVTKGMGATKPAVPNARAEQDHASNRRAEIVFVNETVDSIGGKEAEAKAESALDRAGNFFKGLFKSKSE